MSDEIPTIYRSESKFAPDGQELERKEMTVKDKSLNKAKKIFQELWDKNG